jgi:hypothetical protein
MAGWAVVATMIDRTGTRNRIVGRPSNRPFVALFLALVLAFQWAATGGPSGARHISADPAGTARLEPTAPSPPFLTPREDARAVVGELQTQPTEKASSGAEANGFAANPTTLTDTAAAAPGSSDASIRPKSPNRAYDARGPPHRV